jgi:uncharacterized protein
VYKLPVMLIKLYQWILSPYIGNQCRFTPTCSHYAIEAYTKFGVLKGTYLTVTRIARCHPWHAGGHDPVP